MKNVVVLLLLMVSTSVFASESYLCIADKITGFKFNKQSKNYEPADFNVRESKYILKNNDNTWEWKDFGETFSIFTCSTSFSSQGALICEGFETVEFNKNNLRYIKTSTIGYIHVGSKIGKGVVKDGENTPFMEIGKCSPM